jgi:hypothetical protein
VTTDRITGRPRQADLTGAGRVDVAALHARRCLTNVHPCPHAEAVTPANVGDVLRYLEYPEAERRSPGFTVTWAAQPGAARVTWRPFTGPHPQATAAAVLAGIARDLDALTPWRAVHVDGTVLVGPGG